MWRFHLAVGVEQEAWLDVPKQTAVKSERLREAGNSVLHARRVRYESHVATAPAGLAQEMGRFALQMRCGGLPS